ncbi:hypothetical protein GCM10011344_38930 [Dokdonia pacifica]|uniref:Natural product n=1 Tax=Dokdonia pacifica TaxID=1627892 RepID=A0A239A0X6_9FLAO|nr:class I lanthipeptide [Dokdonia pacifica]GGG34358.1 hypothetical protein GCM10011344_38930 [Dokdonia pacifica]SNR89190.1 natural product precursor [Dokdonia pacifica]
MKKQVKKVISLKKLTIARVQTGEMNHIKGGDCIPTSHCYEDEDLWTIVYCGYTVNIP